MSIAPFLPGLPAAVLPDGSVPAGDPADPTGGQPGFGDAFAAALAGALAVPAAPQPVLTSVATLAAAPEQGTEDAAAAPVAAPETAAPEAVAALPYVAPPVDLALPTRDLALPTRELGVPTGELGVPTRDLGVPTMAPPTAPTSALTVEHSTRPTTAAPAAPTTPATGADTSTVEPAGDDALPPMATSPSSVVASPSSRVESANSTVGKAVVQQVFPEVTRMASTAGNGTHRITLTLQPEQLGEVRVTLVVRDGAVHVRLAGGDGAEGAAVHRALAGGAPELQRLLERTGAEARVSVRDPFAPLLPSGAAPATSAQATTTAGQPGAQPGLQTGPDAQASEGQPREQAPREQPGRDQPRRQETRQPSYLTEPTPATGRLDRTV